MPEKIYEYARFQGSCTFDELAKIDEAAAAENLTRSGFMIKCCNAYIDAKTKEPMARETLAAVFNMFADVAKGIPLDNSTASARLDKIEDAYRQLQS